MDLFQPTDASMEHIEFTLSRDGTRLATATCGKGPLLIKAANWLTHIEKDRNSPIWSHWIEGLASGRRLLRYDERGTGLSDREVPDVSFERMLEDLEAVADYSGEQRFDLVGISQGGAVAIEYACRHPDRVRKLVVYGAYAQGWNRRESMSTRRRSSALAELIRLGWDSGTDAYLELFAALHIPGAGSMEVNAFVEACRSTTTPEMAARLFEAFGEIDIRSHLPKVRMPALVLHARHEEAVPFEQGKRIAAGIPRARCIPLESRAHVLGRSDPAWAVLTRAIDDFLAPVQDQAQPALWDLTVRERDVLGCLVRGESNTTIAEALGLREKSVRNYLTIIYEKLGVASRAQAIALVRDHGLKGRV